MFKFLVIVILIGALAWARKSTPAGDKHGTMLLGKLESSYQPEVIRVASFNIQTGKSHQGHRDIWASAKALQAADLAGVQEVYAPNLLNLSGMGMSQTESLAYQGNFAWLFCATRRRWLREHRGNALLSKLPVSEWRVEMLPDQSGKSFRNMTVAKVEWQGQSFHFINTHLHTKQGRAEQLEVVLQEFNRYPKAILVGDFNSTLDEPLLAQALKDIDVLDAVNVADLDIDNSQRIDWILTRGFKVEEGRILEKGISDHPYYEVSLSYK